MHKRICTHYGDLPKCSINATPPNPYIFKNYKLGYDEVIFKKNANFHILSVGCSYTFCWGLEPKYKWPLILCNLIDNKYGYIVQNLNLGLGAASNDYISRCVSHMIENFHIDLVIILFTWFPRREFVLKTGDFWRYGDWIYNMPLNPYIDFCRQENEYEDKRNFDLNFKFVTSILEVLNVNYIYGFAPRDMDKKYFLNNKCFGELQVFDTVSDVDSHPGRKTCQMFAEILLDKIEKLNYLPCLKK